MISFVKSVTRRQERRMQCKLFPLCEIGEITISIILICYDNGKKHQHFVDDQKDCQQKKTTKNSFSNDKTERQTD